MTDQPPPAGEADLLDPVARARLTELGVRTGKDLAGELTAMFFDTLPQRRQTLHDAIASGDVVTARTTAHTLKGSASAIGARAVAEACAALEKAVPLTTDASAPLLRRLDEAIASTDRLLRPAS